MFLYKVSSLRTPIKAGQDKSRALEEAISTQGALCAVWFVHRSLTAQGMESWMCTN